MSDKAKAYRVVGIDLDIDGERIPEGSEIELVAEPPRKLARWLELLGEVEPVKASKPGKPGKPGKPTKPEDPAKGGQQDPDPQAGQDNSQQPADNAEENKA